MGFTYNDITSASMGIKARLTSWQVCGKLRNFTTTVPGKYGVADFGADFDYREITAHCSIYPKHSFTALVSALDSIAAWLDPTQGLHQLVFDDVPDRYFMARLNDAVDCERLVRSAGSFELKFFCPDPFAYALTDETFSITEEGTHIICHSEGYKQGVASNHGDVMHWFPKHGKSMDTFRAEVKALLATDTKEDTEDIAEPVVTYPEKLTSGYYRVRKTWKDSKSQIGAYCVLANAKVAADKNPGTYVFTNEGVAIYPTDGTSETGTDDYRIHTVVKGDTLWDIATLYLGKGSRYLEIKTLNGLKSNVIYSGWKLKIPN